MLLFVTKPVLLQVLYYRPDFPSVIQEFTWSYEDQIPKLIRTHKFLNYWHKNINAVVAEILLNINDEKKQSWRSIDEILNLN